MSIGGKAQRRASWSWWDPWFLSAGIVALLVATPILVVLSSLVTPSLDIWAHLWETQLLELIWNTLILIVGVGLGVLANPIHAARSRPDLKA